MKKVEIIQATVLFTIVLLLLTTMHFLGANFK